MKIEVESMKLGSRFHFDNILRELAHNIIYIAILFVQGLFQ